MAWKKQANALVHKSNIHFDQWMEEIRKQNEGAVPKDYIGRVAKELLTKVDPKQFLLSHATIVASVDTYEPKNVKLGRYADSRGLQIDVKYPNFRIKPACESIINNNGDAWERSLLLATYRTFIGAPNYLEHIQIPELSKGFIVDAIARDLGDTCYIDILVATDRKHKILVNDVLSGNIVGLSMGCISQFTICSHCGNVAYDDTQLCSHVLYDGKNTPFIDEDGIEHRLGELIGHVGSPNSNQFIEASWVRSPAFSGAVRRNFLNSEITVSADRMNEAAAVYEIRRDSMNFDEIDAMGRAASTKTAAEEEGDDESLDSLLNDLDEGGEEKGEEETADEGEETTSEPSTSTEQPESNKIDELVGQAQEMLMETIVKGLADKLAPKPEDVGGVTPNMPEANYNDTLVRASDLKEFDPKLVKWALKIGNIISKGPESIKSAGLTPQDLIVYSWIYDTSKSKSYPAKLYKLAMGVGPSKAYPSNKSYLAACEIKLGRGLTKQEANWLTWKGKLASLSGKF